MINIELSLAVALYISFTVGAIIVYWVLFERPKGINNYSAADRHIWKCSICTYFYVDSKSSSISTCPRCSSYNKREDTVKQKEAE